MHVKSFPSKDQGPSQKLDRLSIEPGVRADQGKTNFFWILHSQNDIFYGFFFSRSVTEQARKHSSMKNVEIHFATCIIEELQTTNEF